MILNFLLRTTTTARFLLAINQAPLHIIGKRRCGPKLFQWPNIFLLTRPNFSVSRSTIFALSSGQGRCGVAVVRMSGLEVKVALLALSPGLKGKLPPARKCIYTSLNHPKTGELIDKGIIVWFPGPRSVTGEDVCEFHVHGGRAVVKSLLGALSLIPRCQPATPGEFTRRAFLNGKMDLLEVEGLADLLVAETEAQHAQALKFMNGQASAVYLHWRELIIQCMRDMEVCIDFGETEGNDSDEEEVLCVRISHQVQELMTSIETSLKEGTRAQRIREGLRLAILGPPNAGKSSLLNLLCDSDAAMVSPVAGTTRDVVERPMNIWGYPVVLMDTAGLRHFTSDPLEREGMDRALKGATQADLILVVLDVSSLEEISIDQTLKGCGVKISKTEQGLMAHLAADGYPCAEEEGKACILVLNKRDLLRGGVELTNWGREGILLSCFNKLGLDDLWSAIKHELHQLCGNIGGGDSGVVTRERHRHHLLLCLSALQDFLEYVAKGRGEGGLDFGIASQLLSTAAHHLKAVVGTFTNEDILDRIFSDFCIGK